jgi:hypothetical protein
MYCCPSLIIKIMLVSDTYILLDTGISGDVQMYLSLM